MQQNQLGIWRNALEAASHALAAHQTNEAQYQWLPMMTVKSILQREDMLRITLAPFLQPDRYEALSLHQSAKTGLAAS